MSTTIYFQSDGTKSAIEFNKVTPVTYNFSTVVSYLVDHVAFYLHKSYKSNDSVTVSLYSEINGGGTLLVSDFIDGTTLDDVNFAFIQFNFGGYALDPGSYSIVLSTDSNPGDNKNYHELHGNLIGYDNSSNKLLTEGWGIGTNITAVTTLTKNQPFVTRKINSSLTSRSRVTTQVGVGGTDSILALLTSSSSVSTSLDQTNIVLTTVKSKSSVSSTTKVNKPLTANLQGTTKVTTKDTVRHIARAALSAKASMPIHELDVSSDTLDVDMFAATEVNASLSQKATLNTSIANKCKVTANLLVQTTGNSPFGYGWYPYGIGNSRITQGLHKRLWNHYRNTNLRPINENLYKKKGLGD